MKSQILPFDWAYRTQPPQQIGSHKMDSVFEYLIFSGSPIHIAEDDLNGARPRLLGIAGLVEHSSEQLVLEMDSKANLQPGQSVAVSFGYKRKRAEFRSKVIHCGSDGLTLTRPAHLLLTNLRKNPRVRVESEGGGRSFEGTIRAETSLGAIEVTNFQIHEISQQGMSLFIDRSQGLLLPGDRITEMRVVFDGHQIFRGRGLISRVNMKRHAQKIPGSYEAILRFEKDAPFKLEELNRGAKRIPVLETAPVYFQAEHSFFPGRTLRGHVTEISSSGLSCLLERSGFPVVPGMRFLKCNLQLPHRPSRDFIFEVAHVLYRSDGENSEFKIGGEFVKSSVELLKDISSYSQDVSGGFIQDVTEEDLDLFWEFLFETNFIYQSKRKQLQVNSKKILETYHSLISKENPIVKKVVYKEEREIKGHLSAIRFYDHTWIFQHLNALKAKTGSAAQAVLEAMIEFFYDVKANFRTDTFYVMTYFRPDNVYPALLFGESCRRMSDPVNSCMIDFFFGVFDEAAQVAGEMTEPSIDQPADYLALSDLLIERQMIPYMRAIGLGNVTSNELRISTEYGKLGLYRYRHLLCFKEGQETVYALVECSSPGLNLSELTNSITIFTQGTDSEKLKALAAGLVSFANNKYFAPEGIFPVIMQMENESRPANVSWSKIYTCWANSTAGFPAFEKHSKAVLSEFPTLVQGFKAKHEAAMGDGSELTKLK